jgi:uncharacterized protein (TIGR03382 family)
VHGEDRMSSESVRRPLRRWLVVWAPLLLSLPARPAGAWAIGSQFNEDGCHEPITAAALRSVRERFDTAPVLTPSRDEAAMIDDVLFAPPKDFVHDLAGMTLMLGVRDNDLKGHDPLSSLELVQVHGNPTTQDEHCIRSSEDDGEDGNRSALAACSAYILKTATEALDGLDDHGHVDPTQRAEFALYVGIRGEIKPRLPVFYLKIAAAMHALEDGFPHTYRTADGMKVIVVLNWIDLVSGAYAERRDGPLHRAELDRCWDDSDPTIHRDYDLATQAATELLAAALDPALDRDHKIARFGEVTTKYLGYQPGCTLDNQWCAPPEATVTNSLTGCNAAGSGGLLPWAALASLGVIAGRRRRQRARPSRIALAGVGLIAATLAAPVPARADDAPATPAKPVDPRPAVPVPASEPGAAAGKEPGRDTKTPTVTEVAAVRSDKKLGNPLGFAGAVGASVDRPAFAVTLGARYRITESWVVGLDAGWNPWLTTSPMSVHAGVATVAGTLIRRFPMRFDRVNLRTSLHAGTATLLYDVFGAPRYSTGPFIALSPLGLDYDLGHATRIVWDPVEIALPVPLLGQLPLYYEQFRMMIGIQIGG